MFSHDEAYDCHFFVLQTAFADFKFIKVRCPFVSYWLDSVVVQAMSY